MYTRQNLASVLGRLYPGPSVKDQTRRRYNPFRTPRVVVTVEAHVSAPPGEDQWINVRAYLVQGEEIIAQGEERFEGEAEVSFA